MSRKVNKKTI